MKSPSNPYKTHWNTTGIARNTSTDIVSYTLFMTYLHDAGNLLILGYVLYLPHASYSLWKWDSKQIASSRRVKLYVRYRSYHGLNSTQSKKSP